MTTVHIPAPLRHLTEGAEQVTVTIPPGQQRTVRELLTELEQRHPGLMAELTEAGELSPYLAVFVDGEQAGMGLQTKITEENEVFFLAPVAGG